MCKKEIRCSRISFHACARNNFELYWKYYYFPTPLEYGIPIDALLHRSICFRPAYYYLLNHRKQTVLFEKDQNKCCLIFSTFSNQAICDNLTLKRFYSMFGDCIKLSNNHLFNNITRDLLHFFLLCYVMAQHYNFGLPLLVVMRRQNRDMKVFILQIKC